MSSPDLHTPNNVIPIKAATTDTPPEVPPRIYDEMLELLDSVAEAIEAGDVGSLVIAAVSPTGEMTDHSYIVDLKIPNRITAELRQVADELHDRFRDREFYEENK